MSTVVSVLLVSLAPWFEAAGAPAGPAALPLLQADCTDVYDRLMADPDWLEALVDPLLTTGDEISDQLQLYADVYRCLQNDPDDAPAALADLDFLFEYFLIFAAGLGPVKDASVLRLVSLETSDDPAVVALREEVGLPPPAGMLFVRFYPSRERMPARVRRAFTDENVKGVTIFTRYIAVLVESKLLLEEEALQRLTLPETVSHELAHAYVNASLGAAELGSTPTWYDEGMAIYFSGSGEEHTVVMQDLSVTSTSSEDYRQYETNFDYLEAKHGRDRFLELIRESVVERSPERLFSGLEIHNVDDLAERASAWKNRRLMIRLGLFGAAALLVGWQLFKLAPQVRCRHCRHGGRRSDFDADICPNCRRQYNSPHPGPIIGPVRPEDRVRVHMTGRLENGSVFDTTQRGPPRTYPLDKVWPALAEGLTGMFLGETRTVHIPAGQAAGPHRPELVLKLDRSQLAHGASVQTGRKVTFRLATGQMATGKVVRRSREWVKVDVNHPLAGHDLTMEIKLVEIL